MSPRLWGGFIDADLRLPFYLLYKYTLVYVLNHSLNSVCRAMTTANK